MPRDVAIFLARGLTGESCVNLGSFLGAYQALESLSGVRTSQKK